MSWRLSFGMGLAAGVMSLSGQSVSVYSEFQRVSPDGHVLTADRVEARREIISPAVPRNAFSTFRIAVGVPSGTPYTLHIAQNPESTAIVRLYREQYARIGKELVADAVSPVELPEMSAVPAGQSVQTYLLDMFVPAFTPPDRFRLEVQLNVGERWVIYPMEIRPREVMLPRKIVARAPLAGTEARADASAMTALREYACGERGGLREIALETARAFIDRNVRQDIAMAETREKQSSHAAVANELARLGGWPNREALCRSRGLSPLGAEWWLKARTYLQQAIPTPPAGMLN